MLQLNSNQDEVNKCDFYRAAKNAIFEGRIGSEEVILQLVKSKFLRVLLYDLEVCPLTKTDVKSLDFVINRLTNYFKPLIL